MFKIFNSISLDSILGIVDNVKKGVAIYNMENLLEQNGNFSIEKANFCINVFVGSILNHVISQPMLPANKYFTNSYCFEQNTYQYM